MLFISVSTSLFDIFTVVFDISNIILKFLYHLLIL